MLPKQRLITVALQAAAAGGCSARAQAILAHYIADSWPHAARWRACTFNAELARRLSCSTRMVQVAAAELVQAGIITRVSKSHVLITVDEPSDDVSDRATGCAVGDGRNATHSATGFTVTAQQVAPTAQQVAPYPVQVKNILARADAHAHTREAGAQPQASSHDQPPGVSFVAVLAELADEPTSPATRSFLQARLRRRALAQAASDQAASPCLLRPSLPVLQTPLGPGGFP